MHIGLLPKAEDLELSIGIIFNDENIVTMVISIHPSNYTRDS